jgi:lysophospholipase L1-like esterase
MKKNIIGIIILIVLIILSFIGISSTLYSKPNLPNDTIIVIPKVQDTVVSINGKYATFIGDSHTSNHNSGWQVVVCKKTGLRMNNLSVSGKTTGWMLEMAKTSLHKGIDYCFIYGGANDMFTKSITPKRAVSNIQQIVDFYTNCLQEKDYPEILHNYAKDNLTWNAKLKPVAEALKNAKKSSSSDTNI